MAEGKCYIRNFKYEDGSVRTFHSICDGQDYATGSSVVGKLTDAYGQGLKADVPLVEVKDEVHESA